MTGPPLTKVLAAVLVAAFVWIGMRECQLADAREAARDAGLARDSAEAVADVSRDITRLVASIIGDSVRASERRILQVTPTRTELDRALGRVTTGTAQLSAQVRGLVNVIVDAAGPTTEDTSGTRRGVFAVREPPVSLWATATLPRPPALGRLVVDSLDVDPIPVNLDFSCGPRRRDGIRPAVVAATAPSWATIDIGDVQQSPETCNPREEPAGGWSLSTTLGPGITWNPFTGDVHGGATLNAGLSYSWQIRRLWPF